MKTKGNKLFNRVASFMLAMVMVLSVFAAMPTEVAAADVKSIAGKGTSSVTYTDEETYDPYGYYYMAENYIKFTAKNTGYVTVKMTNASTLGYADGYVALCDYKKAPLNATNEYWNTGYDKAAYYTRTFGVKKGKTYYIKVESTCGVTVTATFKTVKKANNSSKKKAATLNKNKKVTGVIVAGDKTVDWYKIKVTNDKQKVKITYSGKTNGNLTSNDGIKVTFCDSKGKVWYSEGAAVSPWVSSRTYKAWCTVNGKVTGVGAGTYYIKVERSAKTSSGTYTLKWSTY